MHEFVQLAVGGLLVGGIYVMIAIGMSLILDVTGILHIAHGANISLCALTFTAVEPHGFVLAVAATLVVSLAFTMAAYDLLYRPVAKRQADLFPLFLASFGLWIVGSSALTLVFSANATHPPTSLDSTIDVAGLHLVKINLMAFGAAIVCYLLTRTFLRRTMTGSLMRAAACNGEMADVWGMPRRRAERVAFVIAALLSVPAGIFAAYIFGAYPTMGDVPLLIAFATVIIGGVGSITGAAAGALIFGVIQGVALWQLPPAWQEGVVFTVFLLIILIAPRGLAMFGKGRPKRAKPTPQTSSEPPVELVR